MLFTKEHKLYFFGTSYTVGGPGWLFEQPEVFNSIKAYPDLPTPTIKSMSVYSYPGALQQLLDSNNINYNKFINLAKEGFGLERIVREIYKLILSENFNKDKTTLFIELTDNIYRRDTYFPLLNDYIIGNHAIEEDGSPTDIYYAHTWHQDSSSKQQMLDEYKSIMQAYHKLTFNQDQIIFNAQNTTIGLISFLDKIGVEYYLVSGPYFVTPALLDTINFDHNRVIFKDLEEYIKTNKLTFADHTNSFIVDNHHASIEGNKLIAQIIYDFLFL